MNKIGESLPLITLKIIRKKFKVMRRQKNRFLLVYLFENKLQQIIA